jgi:ABC-type transport system involved in multi-copper enzyme maturation permease subunit
VTLFRFYLRRYRLLFLGLLGLVLAHEFSFIIVFQHWREHAGLGKALLNFVPEKIRHGLGIPLTDITHPATYKALIMMRPDLRALLAAFGVAIGSDVIAGETTRGTSDLLFSHPVRRRDVVLAGMAVTAFYLACSAGVMLGGYAAAVAMFPMGPGQPTLAQLSPAVLNVAFASFGVALTAFVAGTLTRSRARAVAWSVFLFFLPMVLHFVAVFSDTARWFARLFPDYYYRPHTILMGIEKQRFLAPLAIMAVCVAASLFFAERRDLVRE